MEDLSEGIPVMPRVRSARERFADAVFLNLHVLSAQMVLLGIGIGLRFHGLAGAGVGAALGWCVRSWIRYSLGNRASHEDGFIRRLEQRAAGSRTRFLEFCMERIRGTRFTRQKCQAIVAAYDEYRSRLEATSDDEQRRVLLMELDRRVKALSYD